MPVRKLKKSYTNVTGVPFLSKRVGPVHFESTLERDFLTLLEFSNDVKSFEVQPLKLPWFDHKPRPRKYTPDTLVHFRDELGLKPWLCEVKYRRDIKKNWPELHQKFRWAIRFSKEHGWRFRIFTEVEIRTQFLINARFLIPYRRQQFPQDRSELILQRVEDCPDLTPEQIIQSISPDLMVQAEWIPVLWQLVANGDIYADLDQPLTMASPLRRQE